MSSASVEGGSSSKRAIVIALAVVGVLLLILAVLYFVGVQMGPLDTLLHSGKAVVKGSHGIRGAVSGVVGIVCLVAAFVLNKKS